MSIERLNKAATAAGYAMATPEDDAVRSEEHIETAPSRAVVVADPALRKAAEAGENTLANWLKGYLPSLGGRQPA